MMGVPDFGSASQQQPQNGSLGPPMARAPMAPGHPNANMMQQQQMGGNFHNPGMNRHPSAGMAHGANFGMPGAPSPGSRSSFTMPQQGYHMQSPAQHMQHPMQQQPQQQQHPQHMGMAPGPAQHPNMGGPGGMPPSNQRPRQYMQPGMNGSWQSDKDMPSRREMIQHIVKMLKKDRNGSPEWLQKLPQMAKQLEVSLYRNARSFEDYMDMSTLKQRLQVIAMEVSKKARQGGDRSNGRTSSSSSQQPSQMYGSSSGMHHNSSGMDHNRGNSGGYSMSHQPQQPGMMPQQQQQMQPQQQQRVVNMGEINPMAESSNRTPSGGPYMGSNGGQRSTSRSGQGISSSPSSRNDSEWKMRIRHKQQRLLLLHHSAKCQTDGTCQVTPHCADMKRLWRHMEGCKDNNCRVPHCFSSRAILSHYRKCKDANCPACGPVRDTVRKSNGKRNQQKGSSGHSRSNDRSQMQNQMMNAAYNNGMGTGGGNMGMGISASPDPIAPGMAAVGNNFQPGANSFSQQGQQPHSSMPPPGPSMSNNGMGQFNMTSGSTPSGYRSSSSSQQPNQGVQPLYNQQKSDPMVPAPPSMSSSSTTSTSATAPVSNTSNGGAGGSGSGGSRRNDSEWQKVRHKQQRLLLLRHASKCQYEAGKCPVTPHCASMKKLWEHIAHCKNQQCTVQHCMSSRYVLSHYRRCKDSRCPACGPVRETIRKSHDRDKQRGQPQPQGSSSSSPFPPSTTKPKSPDQQPRRKKAKVEPKPSVPAPTVSSSASAMASSAASKGQHPMQQKSRSRTPPNAVSVKAGGKDKKSDDHSLINSFTTEEIETHIGSLNRAVVLPPAKLKAKLTEVLTGLKNHTHGWVFNTPVDPVELGLPDYFDIIKKPMDLGTVNKKLDNGAYRSIEEFAVDVNLTFNNAMTYNEDGSVVHDMARELREKFGGDHRKLLGELEKEDKARRQNERACTMCGTEKLIFEPPVFFCNGMNCASKRIRRNSHFYIGGNNQYFWCNTCYQDLDGNIPIELADMSIMKADLKKRKNDEVHEESWVQCDGCESWVHQICGLFNTRQNKEHHSTYYCPKCLLRRRKEGKSKSTPRPPSAKELPRTKLSEYLETDVHSKVNAKMKEMATERAETAKIPYAEAYKQVTGGGKITIRQVTATDRKLEVRELMKKRYADKNYPSEFPFRCKCLVLFQEMDGVDVILFALYVYEHGDDNPPPNKRVVYISYLDSVHFMRPRKMRTFVYHELLISYLDYARKRGFSSAHIWACPPLKGDDYIFYAKPEDQKTPRDARLRQWYIDMLIESQKRNIVGKVTNMYDLYFSDESLDATAVPYLEGDYFPGEAENIIKELEEGRGKRGSGGGKKNKKKAKAKKRSNVADDDELIAAGILDPKTPGNGRQDEVMVKLGETILPMKDSFIVAFLNCPGAKSENLVVPQEIADARKVYAEQGKIVEDTLISRKRDKDGNPKSKSEKVIDDDDEDMDCEFLNDRQSFLNLCRGNHYQFDELRRAKHTSMMVLWHLHNRDAPKFVQQCASCSREILSGYRYHCNTCPEYDLCEDCYKNTKCNRGSCTHSLQRIAVENSQEGQNGSTNGLTEAQRRERQRNLQLHIQLIEHASRCVSPTCKSSNCAKMKQYLQHAKTCKQKSSGGCKICKRIWTLLRIHAQKCKEPVCPIPQCMAIRERIRQLAKQQQAMDDRRRQEMNRAYRMSMTQAG
eukprot:CAMPEP_0194032300 /NCGR_PEP_ID=MMETSP0009_2-20130614/5275_1 /TAXON_ID=210454 /ORGANISM="Grammatophora oceanica, Strain CCMP 410" /LENGTH=1696 /DNA_ID=CAMNT_0038672697 /DNA_START=105 /DNA_END=5195 /DNA_ORIENTATION=+